MVIDKFKAVGAKLEKEVDALQAKTWTRKLVSPKGDGLFVQDLYMYFPPTAITDTQITNAFNQSLKDQTPENDDDCKMSIEAYYTAFKKKKKLTDDEFSSMKDKVQACKNEFYGDWQGLFGGGGKKYDEYLDVLSGVRNGKDGTQSPRTYGDTSKWKLN